MQGQRLERAKEQARKELHRFRCQFPNQFLSESIQFRSLHSSFYSSRHLLRCLLMHLFVGFFRTWALRSPRRASWTARRHRESLAFRQRRGAHAGIRVDLLRLSAEKRPKEVSNHMLQSYMKCIPCIKPYTYIILYTFNANYILRSVELCVSRRFRLEACSHSP